eukprot:gene23931-biopygen5871
MRRRRRRQGENEEIAASQALPGARTCNPPTLFSVLLCSVLCCSVLFCYVMLPRVSMGFYNFSKHTQIFEKHHFLSQSAPEMFSRHLLLDSACSRHKDGQKCSELGSIHPTPPVRPAPPRNCDHSQIDIVVCVAMFLMLRGGCQCGSRSVL